MEIFNMEQGSPEWFQVRLGIPTSSCFSKVMAKGEGKTRSEYMRKLAGEVLTGGPSDGFSNGHMERGKEMEPQARSAYEIMFDTEVEPVGFVRNHGAGASTDGFVGTHGMVEIKTMLPHILIDVHDRGRMPPAHVAQVQGGMWITGRQWCDFIGFWPGLPLYVERIERDDHYIVELSNEVAVFNRELAAIVERMRGKL